MVCSRGLRAQQQNEVTIVAIDTLVNVANDQLADVAYEVVNNGSEKFSGGLHFYVPKQLRIVNKDHLPLYLSPGEKKYIVVKVYAKSNATAGSINCQAQLFNNSRTFIVDRVTKINVISKREVRASLTQSEMPLPQRGEAINIPLGVANMGNTRQHVSLVIAYPAVLNDETNASIALVMPPFSDTVIYFKRRVTAAMRQLDMVKVNIAGIYEDGDFFASQSLILQDVRSKRNFFQGNNLRSSSGLPNSISLGVQNLGTFGEAYFLRSNGEYKLGDATLSYNLNMLQWKAGGLPTQINNTWINYENKGLGIHLGNISNIGEVNLNGRGAEVYFNDTNSKKGISIGFVDKSFNLIGTKANNYSFGKSAWLTLKHTDKKLNASSMFLYDTEQFFKTKSLIWINDAQWNITDGLQASARLGLAGTQPDNVVDEKHIGSMLIGASLSGFISKRLSISIDNHYSSGYFPGTRRGTTMLNERLSYHFLKSSIFASYNNYNYQPRFINSGIDNFLGTYTQTQIAEFGFMHSLNTAFSYSISPAGYKEKGSWLGAVGATNLELEAARLNAMISVTSAVLKQSLSLRLEGGQYKTTAMSAADWQYRASLNWNYKMFRMTATAQHGLFLLAESFRQDITPEKFYRYSISPMVSTTLFNKKLLLEGGVNFYKDNYIDNLVYLGLLQYDFRKTRLFGHFQYSTFNNSASYNNIMLGLTRTLPGSSPDGKMHKNELSVLAFRDYNGNGIFDDGDKVAANEQVFINGTLFNTNSNGSVTYSRLPDGNYRIRLSPQNGWYAEGQEVLLTNKSKTKLNIALKQTGTVLGNISFQDEEDENLNYAVHKDKAVQTIVAVNERGNSIVTKTNDNGHYVLYLPAGKYQLSVIGLPSQIESATNSIAVELSAGKTIEQINFVLKVKQRKIEVKKFGKKTTE